MAATKKKSIDADGGFDPAAQLAKLSADPPLTRGVAPEAGPVAPSLPDGFFAAYTGAALAEPDFVDAAGRLGCDVAAVKAVADVETAGAGFDAAKRPTLLYERHVFARCTTPPGRFDRDHPDLSGLHRPYPPGGYGSKDQQFGKLAQAFQLDPQAALKAPSWGKFQILGENHKACGFATVEAFAKAMTISEVEHLKAFIAFVAGNASLLQAIRRKDWTGFAKSYNGPAFATFKYDTKLAAAFARYGGMG